MCACTQKVFATSCVNVMHICASIQFDSLTLLRSDTTTPVGNAPENDADTKPTEKQIQAEKGNFPSFQANSTTKPERVHGESLTARHVHEFEGERDCEEGKCTSLLSAGLQSARGASRHGQEK